MGFGFPGFRDGHCHPLFAAREAEGPKLDDIHTVNGILEALKAYLQDNPGCAWVDAGSVDRSLVATGQLDASVLDGVSRSVPVVVHASDHHAIWVNTAALRTAGLEHKAPVVPNAHIDVDVTGKPTGMIHEWDAMNLIYVHQPKPSLESDLMAWQRAQDLLLSCGIVAVQEAWIDPGMPEVYLAAVQRDELFIRVNLAPRIAPQSWRTDLNFAKATRSAVRAAGSPLLTCNTVKLFIDGVIGSKTALLKDSYGVGGSQADSSNGLSNGADNGTGCKDHGNSIWAERELLAFALAADAAGFQLHFHAIGDAAVSQALDAIEHVEANNGFVDRRPVIAHAELVDQSDMVRIKNSGTIVCQQPVWARPDDNYQSASELLGHDRAKAMYPIKSLLNQGVIVSFGSDWPVSHPNPLEGVYSAVTRTGTGLAGFAGEHEAIDVKSALYSYSAAVAYQLAQDVTQDWVEFDRDLTLVSPEEILAAKVLRVSVAGRVRTVAN